MRLRRRSSPGSRLLGLLSLAAIVLLTGSPARTHAAPRQCPVDAVAAGHWSGSFTGVAERRSPNPRLHDTTNVAGLIALTVPDSCGGDTTPVQGSAFAAWDYDGGHAVSATGGESVGAEGVILGGALSVAPEGLRPGAQFTWQSATRKGRPGDPFDVGYCQFNLAPPAPGSPAPLPCLGEAKVSTQPAPDFTFTIDAVSDSLITGTYDVTQFAYFQESGRPYFDATDATVVRNHGEFTLSAGDVSAMASHDLDSIVMNTVTNTTLLAASGLHLTLPAGRDRDAFAASVALNTPACAAPRVTKADALGSRSDVAWPDACVAPGGAVTLFVWLQGHYALPTADQRPPAAGPLHTETSSPPIASWSRDGVLLTPDMATPPEPARSWLPTAPMNEARAGHSATLLQDGSVLVAGGDRGTAETFDPRTETWTPTGPMTTRYGGELVHLTDGRVLCCTSVYPDSTSSDVYDPGTRNWTATGPIPTVAGGAYHATSVVLADGRVLRVPAVQEDTTVGKLFDPATLTWTLTAPLQCIDAIAGLAALPDGRAVAVGGAGFADTCPERAGMVTEVFKPTSNQWTVVDQRREWAYMADGTWSPVTLHDGTLLMFGSLRSTPQNPPLSLSSENRPMTLRFDPTTDAWTETGAPPPGRGALQLLADGTPFTVSQAPGELTPTMNVYDLATDTWQPRGAAQSIYAVERVLPLTDGGVLLVGPGFALQRVSERFDAATEQWGDRATFTRDVDRTGYTLTALPNGGALIAGGEVGAHGQEPCRYGCSVASTEMLPGH